MPVMDLVDNTLISRKVQSFGSKFIYEHHQIQITKKLMCEYS